MNFNEFSLKTLSLKLREMFPEFMGINIIKSYQPGSNSDPSHFMIVKIKIKGIDIYFEHNVDDNPFVDVDIFEQCINNIKECIDMDIPYFNGIDVSYDFAEEQIINALIYRTGKTIEDHNHRLFNILGREAANKNPNLADLQLYIEAKFAEGGDWEALLEGPEDISFNTVIRRNKG